MTLLLKHPLVIVIITVVAIFYYVSLDKSAQKANTSSEAVQVLEQEMQKMTSDVSLLERELEAANHPVAQEKIIRNELLLQKPGEYVLQLPPLEVTEQTPPQVEKKTPWEEWKEILF